MISRLSLVQEARDERAGKALPDGARFPLTWPQNEAVVISFG